MSLFFTGLPKQLNFLSHKAPAYAGFDKQNCPLAKGVISVVVHQMSNLEGNCYIPSQGDFFFSE